MENEYLIKKEGRLDRNLINALVNTLNMVKTLYDMTYNKTEDVVRPLMDGAITVARILNLPHDKEEDGQSIDKWVYVSDNMLSELDKMIQDRFGDDGDAS